MLRNLSRRWAIKALVKHNDDLRRRLVAAEARVERQEQTMRQGVRTLDLATAELDEATATVKQLHAELDRKEDQIQRQANLFEQLRDQKDAAQARVRELEQTVVSMSAARGGLDKAWADVAAVQGRGPR